MTDRELLERSVEEVTEVKTRLGNVEDVTDIKVDVVTIKADVKVVKDDVATIKAVLPVTHEAQNIATVRRAASGRRTDATMPLAARSGQSAEL